MTRRGRAGQAARALHWRAALEFELEPGLAETEADGQVAVRAARRDVELADLSRQVALPGIDDRHEALGAEVAGP